MDVGVNRFEEMAHCGIELDWIFPVKEVTRADHGHGRPISAAVFLGPFRSPDECDHLVAEDKSPNTVLPKQVYKTPNHRTSSRMAEEHHLVQTEMIEEVTAVLGQPGYAIAVFRSLRLSVPAKVESQTAVFDRPASCAENPDAGCVHPGSRMRGGLTPLSK